MFSKILATTASLFTAASAYSWTPAYGTYRTYVDNSTFGNCDMVHTTHYHVDWEVNFKDSQLVGSITHDMDVLVASDFVTMDSWNLNVQKVEMLTSGSAKSMRDAGALNQEEENAMPISSYMELEYDLNSVNDAIGNELYIYLPATEAAGSSISLKITYTTSKDGQAFSWLTASQTAGLEEPYVFTQCEDINCRTVAPTQDTPSNRVTYSARVITTNTTVAKMSANETSVSMYNATHNQACFACDIAIPNYLMALVVGKIEYKSTGYRTGVITEPAMMDKVYTELEGMALLLDTTETYMGRYIWGNYTIIILPPSFPMGGMENPLLTFASPTIIVGDKSQVYVATHEMVHSWTGNTVTCRNWEHFWLNEGWTVFVERKVSGILYGEDFSKIEAQLGNVSLSDAMFTMGSDTTLASIHPVLKGANPDSSFSTVPYEKGFQLVSYLESLIGDDMFQLFAQFHIEMNFLQSITSVEFRQTWEQFIEMHWESVEANEILSQVDWSAWLYEVGFAPQGELNFSTEAAQDSQTLAQDYINGGGDTSPANMEDYFSYTSNEKVIFHTYLNASDAMNVAIQTKVDADYNVTGDADPEVKQRWLAMGIYLSYGPALEPAHTWMGSMGRNKYLDPIYIALQATGQHDTGVQWLCENMDFYCPVTSTAIETDLHLEGPPDCNAFDVQLHQFKHVSSENVEQLAIGVNDVITEFVRYFNY